MSKYTKYKLYQKYETRGSQEAIPVYPNTFSIDGDGTMPLVIVEENSRDCGYTGDTQPIYRWYNMPIDKYYVCDACSSGYENQYLTFVARERTTFMFNRTIFANAIEYSVDNGSTWVYLPPGAGKAVDSGQKIMWRGNMTSDEGNGVGQFLSSGLFEVEGNIMSLLYGDNFRGQTSLSGKDYVFKELFSNSYSSSRLTSIDNLVLPATTLTYGCYSNMFNGCTSLTTVPSNLLPATTLAEWCYSSMFYGCSSLATAPDLSATTLEDYCYNQMFKDCTSLSYVKCLATDISATYCLGYWLYNVSSSGTFVKKSSMSGWSRGVNGIPSNWTVQNA